MKDTKTNILKNCPICSFIFVILIILFSMYFTSALKTIPCEKNMISVLYSNFIHTDFYHLMANLFGLYSLTYVEIRLGSKKFLTLILFLLFFTSLLEIILYRIIKTPCTIGFSGILYGVFTFEIISKDKYVDYKILGSIFLNLIFSKIMNSKSSLYGHIIGVISGVCGALIYKKIQLFKN
jgi:membrane associated rhomboid family serine protease